MTSVEAGIDRDASVRPTILLVGTAALIYLADQVTKALIVANLVGDAGALELLAQSQFQLAGGLLAEGDCDDLGHAGAALLYKQDDSRDQLGRLASAGCGLDD